ncbi:hypothetical protein EPUL_002699 [Erysiphe pulchra]|uniref:Uncharacterized protein n=1 Tax=Erysiphe pulchra TaxID=225359 RepID=A0A2S4PTV7_9PEZI|nr:hypothetical protein EPUL_002699 [Erysiphe pulchra]
MTIPIVSKNITTGVQKKPSTHSKSTMIKNTKSKNAKEIISDTRLFVRLPVDHEWRNLSPAGLREVIVKYLAVSQASIGLIKPVHTGFAISPFKSGAREALPQTKIGLLDTGAKLEPASNWVPLLVLTVPKFIRTIKGQTEVTKEMLSNKIERVTSTRPTSVRHYGTSNTEAPHRTWMAYFDKASRPSFRVFDESGRELLYSKSRRRLTFASVVMDTTQQDTILAFTKCKNCGGPHRSNSHKCLARSFRYGGPTKEQLKSFRVIGKHEYQAVARAKAAEQRAIAVTESIVISSSQSSEPSSSDIQQTPIEAPLGEQMRL